MSNFFDYGDWIFPLRIFWTWQKVTEVNTYWFARIHAGVQRVARAYPPHYPHARIILSQDSASKAKEKPACAGLALVGVWFLSKRLCGRALLSPRAPIPKFEPVRGG